MNEIQNRLNDLYSEYLTKVLNEKGICDLIINDQISSPLFINVSTTYGNYLNADLKILYVGKENNKWYDSKERIDNGIGDILNKDQYFNSLIRLYYKFDLGKNYEKPFFDFLKIFIEDIRIKKIKAGVLWSNLLRFDCRKNWNLKNKIFEIDKNEILKKEIEILKPDVVIFVTGPGYDCFLDWTFLGCKSIQIGNTSKREKCIVKHNELPQKTYRIYHPDYHMLYKKPHSEYTTELANEIIELIIE